MFRPSSRRKSERTRGNFDFKFQFHASKVPSLGWDKLVVALIPRETGRPSVKTTKGHVRNGTCQWPDTVTESTTVMLDPATGECDEAPYKLVVSMGSLRAGILGEASINLSEFIEANAFESVALPLKNCSAGTVLHVKIQCLTQKTGVRDIDWQKDASAAQVDKSLISDEDEGGSDLSGNNTSGSLESSASQAWINQRMSSGQMKDGASPFIISRFSYDSSDSLMTSHEGNGNSRGFMSSDSLSSTGAGNGVVFRQNSSGSRDGSAKKYPYSNGPKNQGVVGRPSKGRQDSLPRQGDQSNGSLIAGQGSSVLDNGAVGSPHLSQRGRDYGQADIEAAEATIKELRADAMTCERRANKLNLEVEMLKQQLAAERRNGSEFVMEISALEAERDSLKLEVEQLREAKAASQERESGDDYARWVAEGSLQTIKELQQEIAHEKEANQNLNLQLHKIQDSNLELVSAITELEELLDQQGQEIERLTDVNNKLEALNFTKGYGNGQHFSDIEERWKKSVESEWRQKVITMETDLAQKLASKNEEVKQLQVEILRLQKEDEVRRDANLKEAEWRNKCAACESEWMNKLKDKEEELQKLTTEVVRLQMNPSMNSESKAEKDRDRAIEILKRDMDELERDCKILTDENFYLIQKLDRVDKELEEKTSVVLDLEGKYQFKVSELESLLRLGEQSHKEKMDEKQKLHDDLSFQVKQLEENVPLLEQCVHRSTEEVEALRLRIGEENKEHAGREMELLAANTILEEKVARVTEEYAGALKNIEVLKVGKEEMVGIMSTQQEDLRTLAARLEEHVDALSKTSFIETENVRIKEELEFQVQEKLQAVEKSRIDKEYLEALMEQLAALTTTLEPQLAAKRNLERQAKEINAKREEVENRLTDVEEEKLQLLEKISEVEAQLRLAVAERESYKLEKENARVCIRHLQDETTRLEAVYQEVVCRKENMASDLEKKLVDTSKCAENSRQECQRLEEEIAQLRIEKERIASEAWVEISRLQNEKLELENSLKQMHGDIRLAEEEAISLEKSLGSKIEDMAAEVNTLKKQQKDLENRLQSAHINLEQMRVVEADNKLKIQEFERLLNEVECEKQIILEENISHSNQVIELQMIKTELEDMRNSLQEVELEKNAAESSLHKMIDQCTRLQEEKSSLVEKLTAVEATVSEVDELRHVIAALEEKLHHFELVAEEVNSRKIAAESSFHKVSSKCTILLEEKQDLVAKLRAVEVSVSEVNELRHVIASLEEKLHHFESLVEEVNSEKILVESSLNTVNNQCTILQEEKGVLIEKLTAAEVTANEVEELRHCRTSLEDKLLHFQSLLKEATSEKNVAKSSLQDVSDLCTRQQEENLALTEKLTAVETSVSELDEFREKNAALEQKLHCFQALLDKVNSEKVASEASLDKMDGLCTRLQEENQALVKKLTDVEGTLSEFDDLRHSNTGLEEKLHYFQLLLEEVTSEKNLAESSLYKVTEQCKGLQEERLILAEKIIAMEAIMPQVDELRQTNTALEENLHHLQSSLEELMSEKNVLESSLQNVYGQCSRLQEEKLSLAEKLMALEVTLREMEGLRHNNTSLEEKMCQYESLLRQVTSEKKAVELSLHKIVGQCTVLQEERLALSEKLRALEATMTDVVELRHNKISLEEKLLFFQSSCEELKSEKSAAESSLLKMTGQYTTLQEEKLALVEKLAYVESTMSVVDDELRKRETALKEKLFDFQSLLEEAKSEKKRTESCLQELSYQCTRLQEENLALGQKHADAEAIVREVDDLRRCKIDLEENLHRLQSLLEQVKSEKYAAESSLQKLSSQCTRLQEEKVTLVEKLRDVEATVSELDELRIQDVEQRNESMRLKRQVSEFQKKMTEQEEERDTFKRKVQSLEEELQLKVDGLSRAERQLMERGNCMTSDELHEMLKFLEEEVKTKEKELEVCKKNSTEREAELCDRIERLEMLNEELAMGQVDSGVDQLRNELIRLQNQNSMISKRERELISKVHMQAIFESEVLRLQEENEQLQTRLTRLIENAKYPNLLEKATALETELAEAMEANNMYKLQLRSVFEKQRNVNMAALQELGDVDQIIMEFLTFKRRESQLEAELREMRDRYMLMSLQFAEVESERSELVITVKNLKSTKSP